MQSTCVVLGRLASEYLLGYCMVGSQFLFVWVLAACWLTSSAHRSRGNWLVCIARGFIASQTVPQFDLCQRVNEPTKENSLEKPKKQTKKTSEVGGGEKELLVEMDDNFNFEKAHEKIHSVK